jgi:hypothetical protein
LIKPDKTLLMYLYEYNNKCIHVENKTHSNVSIQTIPFIMKNMKMILNYKNINILTFEHTLYPALYRNTLLTIIISDIIV